MIDLVGFSRKGRTWLAYGALACYAYSLYALGPVLAYLHAELHLSYLVTSLYPTVWAAGTLIAGLAYPELSNRFGRRRLFWAAAAALATSSLLFTLGHRLSWTLLAAGLLGTGGGIVLTGTTVILVAEHGAFRDRALTEANIGASICAVIGPVLIYVFGSTSFGWRSGMVVPVVGLFLLWLRFRRMKLPPENVPGDDLVVAARLPARYWVSVTLVGVVSGIEFCLVFYAALLLHIHNGVSVHRAVSVLTLFYVGELLGRLGGARLVRSPGHDNQIIGVALGVTAVGFGAFWLSRQPDLSVGGLTVAGLGVANLYPLSLAKAVGAAPGRADQASSWAQFAIGAALLTLPLVLGALADWEGIMRAYLIVPALIVVALVLFLAPWLHTSGRSSTCRH